MKKSKSARMSIVSAAAAAILSMMMFAALPSIALADSAADPPGASLGPPASAQAVGAAEEQGIPPSEGEASCEGGEAPGAQQSDLQNTGAAQQGRALSASFADGSAALAIEEPSLADLPAGSELQHLDGMPTALDVLFDDGSRSLHIIGWTVASNLSGVLTATPRLSEEDAALVQGAIDAAGVVSVSYTVGADDENAESPPEGFAEYTVDIGTGEGAYHMTGGATARIGEIAGYLGISGDIASASFSNPSVAEVYQGADGQWYITSTSPFDTDEQLVIEVSDGSGIDVYVIPVTDDAIGSVSGVLHTHFLDNGSEPAEFTITMPDGSTVTGYCQNHGLPAPADADFAFSATWNGTDYDIFVPTGDSPIASGQIDIGQGTQDIGGFHTSLSYYYLRLIKQSASPSLTEGNPMYSLEGAVYHVYGTWENAYYQTDPIATLVTDAAGTATAGTFNPGTYYVRESRASQGYKLDGNIYSVSVGLSGSSLLASGSIATLSVTEIPAMDPPLIEKVDSDLGEDSGSQGDGMLEGAQFEWAYYAGYYASEEDAVASGTCLRHWIFSSDANGYVQYKDTYLVSGDALYTGAYGEYSLPLGTVIIKEIAAPTGYRLTSGTWIAWIIQPEPGSSADYVWKTEGFEGNVVEEVQRAGIVVSKYDSETGTGTPQGDARTKWMFFDIYNASEHSVVVDGVTYAPGNLIASGLHTGDDGTWASAEGWLPYGTYRIVETDAPEGYVLEGTIQVTVSIRQDGGFVDTAVLGQAIKDDVIRGGIEVVKYDADLGRGQGAQGDGDLGATFAVWNESEHAVIVDGVLYEVGQMVGLITADAQTGIAASAADWLPYGTYVVKETSAPTGYCDYAGNGFVFRIREDGVIVKTDVTGAAIEFADTVIRAGLEVAKWDMELDERYAQGDSSLSMGFDVINASACDVYVDGVRYAPGEVVYSGMTDATGLWASAADWLPYGTYRIVETVAPAGYGLSGITERTMVLHEAGKVASMDNAANAIKDRVDRAGLEVAKWDYDLDMRYAQGDSELIMTAQVINASSYDVLVGGIRYAPGSVIATITTDATGLWASAADWLPYGTYRIVETVAPAGYGLSGITERTMVLHEAGKVASMDNAANAIKDRVIRGAIEVEKTLIAADGSTADPSALEGVTIEVVNESAHDVELGGVRYAPGEVVCAIVIGGDGKASSGLLPYGTYSLREVESSVPESIQAWSWTQTGAFGNDTFATRQVRSDAGAKAALTDYEKPRIVVGKVDSETGEAVSQTQFSIWRYEGAEVSEDVVTTDWQAISPDDERWVLIGSAWSDESGIADLGRVAFGIYLVRETYTNPAYMTPAETAGLELDADVYRMFVLDRDHHYSVQVWDNRRIDIKTTVDKDTIDVSAIGHEYWTQTEDGTWVSNVGADEQLYTVDFSNSSNTYADEYWVVDQLQPADSPYDLSVTDLWLPVTAGDTDGYVWLLIRTSSSTVGNVPEGLTFSQPELHAGSLGDGTMRFDASGWTLVGRFSATSREKVDLSTYIADGGKVTAIALCYGAVEEGFSTVSGYGLAYLMKATHALSEGMVYENTAESHISRNWAKSHIGPEGAIEGNPATGLYDDAEDAVETRVIGTFGTEYGYSLDEWGSSWYGGTAPRTGDGGLLAIALLLMAAASGTAIIVVARRRMGGRR